MANLTKKSNRIHIIISYQKEKTIDKIIVSNTLTNYLNSNCEFYAMIKHNLDVNNDGVLKNPHIHLVYIAKSRKRLSTWINEFVDMLNIKREMITINVASDFVGNVRYLLHLDSPEKYQYPQSDIITNSTYDLNDYLQSDSDRLTFAILYDLVSKYSNIELMEKIGLQKYRAYSAIIRELRHEIEMSNLRELHKSIKDS